MSVPKINEYNVSTGETIIRDLTPDELAQWKIDHAEADSAESRRLEDLAQFRHDWYELHADNPSHEVIVRLLRRLLPTKPE